MDDLHWTIALALLAADLVLRIGFSVRVVMRRRPTGNSLAWLTVILLLPFLGIVLYLMIGENRLGEKRTQRAEAVRGRYTDWQDELKKQACTAFTDRSSAGLAQLTEAATGFPALQGNELEILVTAEETLRTIIADIDTAESTCHLEFYIWSSGGTADEVAEALIRAAQRGVECRVLLDFYGSKTFLRGKIAERMRSAGVQLHAALEVGLLHALFVRVDLRNHRKIVVIDGRVAYTGSQNMVDPRFFKQDSGVGEWIDAMVRMEGIAVEALQGTFILDWEFETGRGKEAIKNNARDRERTAKGETCVQVVPSGPGQNPEAIHQILLTALYGAREEIILTTPYFVPGDAMITALVGAAKRGVKVTMIVPRHVDSVLVRHASRSHFEVLATAGVRILQFDQGLLHSKTITIDNNIGFIGSVNLDMRSLWLNFEVTLIAYEKRFTERLRATQLSYSLGAEELDLAIWKSRPWRHRLIENVAHLLAPLL